MQVRFFFEGGFEILRLDIFRYYNAYCAPSIGQDVSHPKLKRNFIFFVNFLKDNLLDNSNIMIGFWSIFMSFCYKFPNSLFIAIAKTQKLVVIPKNI